MQDFARHSGNPALEWLRQQPDLAQVSVVAHVPPKDQIDFVANNKDTWIDLRKELLLLLNRGLSLEQLEMLGLELSVILTFIGDVLDVKLPFTSVDANGLSSPKASSVSDSDKVEAELAVGAAPTHDESLITPKEEVPALQLNGYHPEAESCIESASLNVSSKPTLRVQIEDIDDSNMVVDMDITETPSSGVREMSMSPITEDENGDDGSLAETPLPLSGVSELVEGEMELADVTSIETLERFEEPSMSSSPAKSHGFPEPARGGTAEPKEDDSHNSEMDMSIDEEENVFQIVDGTWETLRAGSSRGRPLASDLIGTGYSGSSRPFFIKERPLNLVIELSDSGSDDEEDDDSVTKPKTNGTTSAPVLAPAATGSGTKLSESVKRRMLELAIQRKELEAKIVQLAAKRRKTAAGKAAGSSTPEVLPTMSQAPPTNTSLNHTATLPPPSRGKSLSPNELDKPRKLLSSTTKQLPISKDDTAVTALAQETERAAEVVAQARQAYERKLAMAKKFEELIATKEAEFAKIRADMSAAEHDIKKYLADIYEQQKQRGDLERGILNRRKEMAEIMKKIKSDEAVIALSLENERALSEKISTLKRDIESKGKQISDGQPALFAQKSTLTRIMNPQPAGKLVSPAPTQAGVMEEPNSDSGSIKSDNSLKQFKDPAFHPQFKPEFRAFLRSVIPQINVSSEGKSVLNGEATLENIKGGKDRLCQDLLGERKPTVRRMMNLNGHLRREDEVALMSDAYTAGVPVNGRWNAPSAEESQNDDAHPPAQGKKRLAPYSSTMSQFRSFRFAKEYDKDIKSLTWSNKVDPLRNICQFESEGGVCHDKKCQGQHFRDIKMSEDEVMLDLLSYNASDLPQETIRELKDRVHAFASKGRALDKLAKTIIQQQQQKRDNDIVSMSIGRKRDLKQMLNDGTSAETEKSPNDSIPDASPGRKDHLSSAAPKTDGKPRLPPKVPILINGLQKAMDGEQVKHGRYFDAPLTEDEFESLVSSDPTNVENWIKYAAGMIPTKMNLEKLETPSSNFNKAMHVLSRGLQANRTSEGLWTFYMELFTRRGEGKDVRESFAQAIEFLPDAVTLWWMWFLWETDIIEKESVLKRMITTFLADGRVSSPVSKAALFDAFVQLSNLYMEDGNPDAAKRWMWAFLTAESVSGMFEASNQDSAASGHPVRSNIPVLKNTIAFKHLESMDLHLGWLFYIHCEHFNHLPEGIFHTYPYNHLTRRDFWEIQWEAHVTPTWGSENLQDTLRIVFERIIAWWRREDTSYFALLRNYFNYMRIVEKRSRDERLRISEFHRMQHRDQDNFQNQVVHLLETTGSGELSSFPGVTFSQDKPEGLPVWNRHIKVLLQANDTTRAIQSLVNCIRAMFTGLKPVGDMGATETGRIVDEALLLYRKALALNIPGLRSTPELKHMSVRTDLMSNPYLWLQYLLLQSFRIAEDDAPNDILNTLEHAFEAVSDPDGRRVLWTEYVRYFLAKDPSEPLHPESETTLEEDKSAKAAMAVIIRALRDMRINMISHPGIASGEMVDYVKPVPLTDPTIAESSFRIYFDSLSTAKQTQVLDQVARGQLPLGLHPFTAKAAMKVLPEGTRLSSCLQILYRLLAMYPKTAGLWRMTVAFEYVNRNTHQAQLLYDLAKAYTRFQ
ncbi:uncharacterized protein EV422DRAFT_533426 [Fimicolochytrium jonesii]|uniref:uncharacterized protein n=1 Tax=Fimicolochytrium jonesii TaxID=1396493 RepID=UPI0022FE5A63|nr:uncharacterized protein EV422DRAFT_533426 [Fimicolochytrium jonesii]KAI8819549.1 hypothetical protein EV422DRAFT_533426 [Fimicolochytrium jonesii]